MPLEGLECRVSESAGGDTAHTPRQANDQANPTVVSNNGEAPNDWWYVAIPKLRWAVVDAMVYRLDMNKSDARPRPMTGSAGTTA